ncbi:MAG: hypothetical protein H7Y11_12385, partial [Armatimonadetes bacterium]|nr:hypothetical protein [Anaerolineae bacterium]
MRRQSGGGVITTMFVMLVVFGGFGVMVWANGQPSQALSPIIPTNPLPTDAGQTWQDALRVNLNGSPVPTIPIPVQGFVPPTLARDDAPTVTPLAPQSISGIQPVFAAGETPTPPPPTVTIQPGAPEIVIIVPTTVVQATSLPSMPVPLSRDPLGWDHYWFARPVAADAVNFGSFYYEYGTNGTRENPYRIHTGIDIANPLDTIVLATGDGKIVFATDPTDPDQT